MDGHNIKSDSGFSPMLTYIATTGAILFGMIKGTEVIMFLQAVSLIGASCVAFVTFYEKVTGNTKIMAFIYKCFDFLVYLFWHFKICMSFFNEGLKWAYRSLFKKRKQ